MLHRPSPAPSRPSLGAERRRAAGWVRLAKPALMALVAASLLSGLLGGLLRAGVALPALGAGAWPGRAVGWHAALMICGFLGTVIGVERAVALRARWAFVAPFVSGLGGALILVGQTAASAALFVLAAAVFALVNVQIVRKQAAPHTVLLLVAALVWLGGNLHVAYRGLGDTGIAAWFAFLVLTIAAERLEMSRLMRRQAAAQPLLVAAVSILLCGVALGAAPVASAWGGTLFGAGLLALALWLGVFDIARHTVRATGLSRYMAVCLLGGYAWLAVAGVSWVAYTFGAPARDAALHALGLGFIVSMVMGHAPVILPAVAGIKVHFDRRFYVPLALLHASLLVRLLGGAWLPDCRMRGAALNAAAIVLFALTMASAAWSWRRRHNTPRPARH
ncbi:hypothetical protein [Aquabacterium sp.]|uniref:hypothetical protein n=1 Tax=Aquabacterium sp. TaxID=1872578 RepID=UPI0035B31D8C